MAPEYLFVYGTLRQQFLPGRRLMLSGQVEFAGHGVVQGILFDIDGYPGLVLSDNTDDQVKGEVYLLIKPQAVLERLDEYEGCSPNFREPQEYKRVQGDVLLADGRTVKAWIYLFNHSTEKLQRITSGDFLDFLRTSGF